VKDEGNFGLVRGDIRNKASAWKNQTSASTMKGDPRKDRPRKSFKMPWTIGKKKASEEREFLVKDL